MRLVPHHVMVGANQVFQGVCRLPERRVAYAGGCFAAVFSLQENRMLFTLVGHVLPVSCICAQDNVLFSGSHDKTIRATDVSSQSCVAVLQGHAEGVISLSVCGLEVASVSSAGECFVWDWQAGTIKQQLAFADGKLPLCCKLQDDFLAVSCTDSSIRVYRRPGLQESFSLYCVCTGHQDWVRSIDMEVTRAGDSLILVTGGRDCKVRLWRVSTDPAARVRCVGDAVMRGHESAVSQVELFHGSLELVPGHGPSLTEIAEVISFSLDRSAIRWRMDAEGVWVPFRRVGEFGGQAGLFGQLGFFGGCYLWDCSEYLAYAYNGSFFYYKNDVSTPTLLGGHAAAVADIAWDGCCLLSTSADQTTRMYCTMRDGRLMEIARPQIHGYALTCMAVMRDRRYKFVSGAEEKVLRVFEAPRAFLETLANITCEAVRPEDMAGRPMGATVGELALTNRPISETLGDAATLAADPDMPKDAGMREFSRPFEPRGLTEPPTEEILLQDTLWPETAKLYGHANEIVSVAASPNGEWIASTCRANQAALASPVLWSCSSNSVSHVFAGYAHLTVTQVCFSPCSSLLLCVTRDRSILVFDVTELSRLCVAQKQKAHERIVWGCSWHSSSRMFATGSRDQTTKIWAMPAAVGEPLLLSSVDHGAGVTAVEFGAAAAADLLAVGLENGSICLARVDSQGGHSVIVSLATRETHVNAVRRLRWNAAGSPEPVLLASCSEDHSVRVFSLDWEAGK